VLCITPRFNCKRLLEGGRHPAFGLHFKGFKRDGFLEHRACQLQTLVMQPQREAHESLDYVAPCEAPLRMGAPELG
jgi:hypothetical protein